MLEDELPDDLLAFLQSDRRLEYDPSTCEIGVFAFRSVEEVEEVELIVRDENGASASAFRAFDLLKSCETYDPRGMLVYIPSLGKYGSYDSEKSTLITYRGMAWSDFLADPARYVNAAWVDDLEISEPTSSEASVDRIVEVYCAANTLEAGSICSILANMGIRATIVGDFLGNVAGFLPLGVPVAPRIWVREGHAGRAREIINEVTGKTEERGRPLNHPESDNAEAIEFWCEECGSFLTFPAGRRGHVETCPSCGRYVDVPESNQDLPPPS